MLDRDRFSNKKFKSWMINHGLGRQEFEDCYNVYTAIRDDKDTKHLKIKIDVAEKVLSILDRELKILETRLW